MAQPIAPATQNRYQGLDPGLGPQTRSPKLELWWSLVPTLLLLCLCAALVGDLS